MSDSVHFGHRTTSHVRVLKKNLDPEKATRNGRMLFKLKN